MTIESARSKRDWRGVLRQKTAKTARWLHIYLSMVSFAIVLFFSVTGFTLNHPSWFSSAVRTREAHGVMNPSLFRAQGTAALDKAALVENMRTREHLHGAVEEVREDNPSVSFSYRAPGYSADVIVDSQTGSYSVTEVRNGFVAVINDLHKGRDSGKVWGWLIDLSAGLLILVSLTGLIILWFIYKRRTSGLLMAGVGLVVCWIVYQIFVP